MKVTNIERNTWMKWEKTKAWAVVLATLIAVVAACGNDKDPAPGSAALRVVHAAPGAPAVDVYARGVAAPLFADLAYGETSAYGNVTEGTYVIDVRAAGAPATSEPAFSTPPVTLGAGDTVTAIAAGLLGSEDPSDTFRVLALAESFAAVGAGEAVVRVVHAGSDAPAVALDLGDDGEVEVASLARFADTGAAGVALPAGQELQVGVRLPASEGGAKVAAFTTPALPAGGKFFVVATGLLAAAPGDETAFALLAVGPDGSIGFIPPNAAASAR